MKLSSYLKDKLIYIVVYLSAAVFLGTFLKTQRLTTEAVLLAEGLLMACICFHLGLEYIVKRSFYKNVIDHLEGLDKKYLLSELLPEASFSEGQILAECLKQCNKSMVDETRTYKTASKEYREYVELWIHEVKTPISAARLLIDNNKNPVTSSIQEELDEVEKYLEQALFYARSNSIEKDYIIKKIHLKDLVHEAVRKKARLLIADKIQLITDNLDVTIYSDSKWLEFMLHQILDNAIKYKGNNPCIAITCKEDKQDIRLSIKDNGIGIKSSDLPKVFEKGYTGTAGREYKKSTGLGLYLCKKLCDKLGLSLQVFSKENVGTEVVFTFPKSRLHADILE